MGKACSRARGLSYGGSLARTEATGYGLIYFVQEYLNCHDDSFEGRPSPFPARATWPSTPRRRPSSWARRWSPCRSSTGWIHDPAGIDLDLVKQIKEVERGRISEYAARKEGVEYHEGRGVWSVPVDIALPCATQNELLLEDAKQLVANGCKIVAEGANMPTTMDATDYLMENGVVFCPGKAANAGGVATSGLEMSQNSERLSWTFEEVDSKLQGIMKNIYHAADDAAKEYGHEGNYVMGANIAGFKKLADAMMAQGIV